MAKWVRRLMRPEGSSSQWHVLASDREFATADALCGERLPGAVEVATSDERTRTDGRCGVCETKLAAKQQALTASRAR